jgi:hypothetical protein
MMAQSMPAATAERGPGRVLAFRYEEIVLYEKASSQGRIRIYG